MNPEENKTNDKIDSIIYKLIMSVFIIAIPYIVFITVDFKNAIITSITIIIFLLVAIKEDLFDLIKKIEKK